MILVRPASGEGARPRIGVSACLLGRNVRYDGGHRRDDFLADRLGHHVEWVPICPEVEIGLGTPRPRIDLRQIGGAGLRMIQEERDITSRVEEYSRSRLSAADLAGPVFPSICGYLFKAKSPSCGLRGVRVFEEDGAIREDGTGIFARAFRERYPVVPVFDESAFADPYAREGVVSTFFTMHRWQQHRFTNGTAAEFHRAHRTLLIARDPVAVDRLDRLVRAAEDPAQGRSAAPESEEDQCFRYERILAEILAQMPSRERHVAALAALVDEIDALLSSGGRERREVHAVASHLASLYPAHADLAETIAKLRELAELQMPALSRCAYLRPHPSALSLYHGL